MASTQLGMVGVELHFTTGMDLVCYQGCPVNYNSANVVVLIDRIIVLNDRKISPRPLCNAKCHIRKRLPFILEMFTKLSSSVLTSPLYRTPPKTPARQCNASGSMRHCPGVTYNSVRSLSTNLSGY
jgi:hypothetical protein